MNIISENILYENIISVSQCHWWIKWIWFYYFSARKQITVMLQLRTVMNYISRCLFPLPMMRGTDELPCDKTNKMTVRPAKTQISLGIRPDRSESLLSTRRKLRTLAPIWVHREDSDQTRWMTRLIWVFAGRTCHFVGFVMRQLILFIVWPQHQLQRQWCCLVCTISYNQWADSWSWVLVIFWWPWLNFQGHRSEGRMFFF